MKNKTALNRMFINGKNNCFITLKDHKANFLNNPKTRLLNPAKNELGRISKAILDKINLNLRNATKVNQWKNTNDVISWFKSIKNKKNCKFISFDIKDFYPTITKELLSKSLNFAETKVQITEDDKKIIYHSRKSLLFDKGNTWMKKGGDIFDAALDAYDGAEVCELAGTFLLEKISEICNKSNIGLYRDDGLSIFRNKSGTQLEKMKKKLQRLFKEYDLEITAESNLKIVNYLDVTFNLKDGTFRPYHKPDDQIQYIHTESNHPPNIIKHIPASIETRLSNLSSTEIIFRESTTHYENNLRQSGYNKKLTYKPTDTNHQKHSKHKRKIIWFNPPFSKNVSTKIGKSFLSLLDLHFSKNHIYSSIFNRSKIKVSYSCMQNIKSVINNHNMKVLNNTAETEESCNCRNKNNCPLDGKCLTSNIIYEAQITSNQRNYKQKVYIGTAETDFKHRFNNHTKSFNLEHYENDTELSKEYWTIKRNHFIPKVTWRIIRKCAPFNTTKRKCYLCLNEKLEIASYKGDNLLNKRSELISKCRHQNKFTLLRHDSKD